MFIDSEIRDRLFCDNAGDLAPDEFYDLILEAVKPSMPYLAYPGKAPVEILPMLDYGQRSYDARWEKVSKIRNINDWVSVIAAPQPGGSEGIYVDVSLVTYDSSESSAVYTETPLFVFKTLLEGPDAYAAMGALAGIISYAVEMFLIINNF